MLDFKFDVIGITETKSSEPIVDVNIDGYKHYSTPSEADKGGALLYIANDYIMRNHFLSMIN